MLIFIECLCVLGTTQSIVCSLSLFQQSFRCDSIDSVFNVLRLRELRSFAQGHRGSGQKQNPKPSQIEGIDYPSAGSLQPLTYNHPFRGLSLSPGEQLL